MDANTKRINPSPLILFALIRVHSRFDIDLFASNYAALGGYKLKGYGQWGGGFMRQWLLCVLCIFWSGSALALDLSSEPLQPLSALKTNPDKVALGKRLFFENRLSHDNSISCAHCHKLEKLGGADGLKHSFGVDGAEGLVNSPTVFNAALNFAQFWDGRASSLETQIDGPLTSHLEMSSSWHEVIQKLQADASYPKQFLALYADGINEINIKNAIVEFERSLITVDSRFDKYLKGDEHAITAEEKHGYTLFKSYGCVACHQGRNLGGNLFQTLGIVNDYFIDFPLENEAGKGRFNVTGIAEDMHRFKVPSLRLVVLTAPYFHSGNKKNLAETIRTMAKYQLGRTIPDHDLHAIIAFLYSLPGSYQGHSLEPKEHQQLIFTKSTSQSSKQ